MKNAIAAVLVAAASLAGLSASDAQAQRYYGRTELQGLKTLPTYTGTWTPSTTTTACVGGQRTRTTTATCSGGTCDPATNPSASKPEACQITCGAFTQGRFPKGGTGGNYSVVGWTSTANLYSQAKNYCEGAGNTGTGCLISTFTSGGSNYALLYYAYGTPGSNPEASNYHYAICQ